MTASISTTLTYDGDEYHAEVVTIDSTFLGREDHGLFTAQLYVLASGYSQNTPGYALDNHIPDKRFGSRRVGTGFGMDQIIAICDVLGVAQWEHVRNQRCFALYIGSRHGNNSIAGLASLDGKRVLIFKDHADAWKDLTA